MNYAGNYGPVSDREDDGNGAFPVQLCPGCGAREPEDCECEPADSELAAYIAVVGDVREPATYTIAGVTRDVPRPRGSAGDDWNDSGADNAE